MSPISVSPSGPPDGIAPIAATPRSSRPRRTNQSDTQKSAHYRAELAHHPLLEQVRLDLGRTQDLVRLRLRHADLLRQLAVRPALAPKPLRCFPRTRAGERDQLRPRLRAMHKRPSRPRSITQTGKPVRLEAAAPLLHRLLRTADLARDPRRRPPSGGREHDPCALDRPLLRRARAHDPLQLASLLDAHPDLFRRCSHLDRLHRRPTGRRRLRSRTAGPCYPETN